MAYFPLFIDLEGARCLVVGGGPVALRKARTLLDYGAQVTVVAPRVQPALAALPGVTVCARPFAEADLAGARLVLAATDDRTLNERISRLCRERAIPVNVADSREESSFLFPSVVRRGPLSVGVTTGGASPTAAQYARRAVEAALPEELGDILPYLAESRPRMQQALQAESEAARAQKFAALFDACMAKGRALTEKEEQALLYGAPQPGKVYLVGAGCGGADWITLRGARALQRCGAVVYDALVAPALLELAPTQAQRIPVGKRAGQPSARQEEINALLVRLARQGKTVVRLKGGDPFVFGRGGEEIEALQAAGIPFEEVPGISSAISIPAQAGIPVTHRRVSRSVTIVTGHTADGPDGLPEDLDTLASLHGTIVFLMGLAALPRLAQGLLDAGKAPGTPAAVVSGGNAPHPACVRGTLADIAEKAAAAGIEPPAVIVIGEVAALELTAQG